MNDAQALELLKSDIAATGTAVQWARLHGMSQAYVSAVVNGRLAPGPMILAALGLEKVVSYRPALPVERR